jgi:yecA family protein
VNSQIQHYDRISALLEQNAVLVDAAEVHGILCGMLAGGMPLECRDWFEPLADCIHQGETLPAEVVDEIQQLYDLTCQQLLETEFSLVLCLPDDAAPINDRGQALINWVQGFMLGFGLHQADLTGCSDDVKEALEDFSEISHMDDAMSEDEESEKALFEVMEYVRVSCMLCFNELGKSPSDLQANPNTVH